MISLSHRCPTHLIDVVWLGNASRVVVRPALPQDADLQRRFFSALSEDARYHRFMTKLPELTKDMALRFADIDYETHVALLACVIDGRSETMIGEARYIVDEGDAVVAEFAVAVAESWQGMGLGRLLLQRLASHAMASGVSCLVADTLACNAAMIALAKGCGFAVTRKREDGRLFRLVKDLKVAHAPRCSEPATQRLHSGV